MTDDNIVTLCEKLNGLRTKEELIISQAGFSFGDPTKTASDPAEGLYFEMPAPGQRLYVLRFSDNHYKIGLDPDFRMGHHGEDIVRNEFGLTIEGVWTPKKNNPYGSANPMAAVPIQNGNGRYAFLSGHVE